VSIVAFAGPSLPAAARAEFPDVQWRPPAEAGDLLSLRPDEVSTICLIDGYFDHRPAVRHKEVLLLLAEGVRIFGSSSIGALRACEMEAFGMIGVGAIFRAYARGTIQGDDEVALIHAGEEHDWRPLSIPLVDVRATLCLARRKRIIDGEAARALLEAASSIHYVDRDWASVCTRAGCAGGVGNLLSQGTVEQKRHDALVCLRAATDSSGAPAVRPTLVRTCFLDALARECAVDLEARCRSLQNPGLSRKRGRTLSAV
jgi:hypothetical protein